jgi:phosphomannomutase
MSGTKIASPVKFGTSGWRGLIADDFTFASVRLAVAAIAEHINAKAAKGAKGGKGAKATTPTVLVGYDTRFYSEEFSQLAVEILQQNKIRTLLCETFTPTPAIALKLSAASSMAPSTSRPVIIPRNTTG